MVFEAAQRAYEEAGGLNPRTDVDAFISCQEDFWEGIAIANEFMPDQLGGVFKPNYTVSGDSLQCLLNAYAMIKTGVFEVVVIESHGKPSEILTMNDIIMFSYDPLYLRPLDPKNVFFLNGIEARSFMEREKLDREALGRYVISTLRKGLGNPRASYAAKKSLEEYLSEEYIIDPLSSSDIAPFTDAAIVAVIASEEIARKLSDTPIWISGVWSSSGTPTPVYEDLSYDHLAREAGEKALRLAGVSNPRSEIDVVELDERFSFVPLMVLKALGFTENLRSDLMNNDFDKWVNPFGGALSEGNPLEAHGLARVLAAYELLKGVKRIRGYKDPEKILVHSRRWPYPRTTTIAVLSR